METRDFAATHDGWKMLDWMLAKAAGLSEAMRAREESARRKLFGPGALRQVSEEPRLDLEAKSARDLAEAAARALGMRFVDLSAANTPDEFTLRAMARPSKNDFVFVEESRAPNATAHDYQIWLAGAAGASVIVRNRNDAGERRAFATPDNAMLVTHVTPPGRAHRIEADAAHAALAASLSAPAPSRHRRP